MFQFSKKISIYILFSGSDKMQTYILYKLHNFQHNVNTTSIHVKFQDFDVNTMSTQYKHNVNPVPTVDTVLIFSVAAIL